MCNGGSLQAGRGCVGVGRPAPRGCGPDQRPRRRKHLKPVRQLPWWLAGTTRDSVWASSWCCVHTVAVDTRHSRKPPQTGCPYPVRAWLRLPSAPAQTFTIPRDAYTIPGVGPVKSYSTLFSLSLPLPPTPPPSSIKAAASSSFLSVPPCCVVQLGPCTCDSASPHEYSRPISFSLCAVLPPLSLVYRCTF